MPQHNSSSFTPYGFRMTFGRESSLIPSHHSIKIDRHSQRGDYSTMTRTIAVTWLVDASSQMIGRLQDVFEPNLKVEAMWKVVPPCHLADTDHAGGASPGGPHSIAAGHYE